MTIIVHNFQSDAGAKCQTFWWNQLFISTTRFLSTDLSNSPNGQRIGCITLQSTNVILCQQDWKYKNEARTEADSTIAANNLVNHHNQRRDHDFATKWISAGNCSSVWASLEVNNYHWVCSWACLPSLQTHTKNQMPGLLYFWAVVCRMALISIAFMHKISYKLHHI